MNAAVASVASERITMFAPGGNGGRNLQVCVLGVNVLVTPSDASEQERANELARLIAALGPKDDPEAAPPPPARAPAKPAPVVEAVRPFVVGERVWCTVHGAEGFCTITEVGSGRNSGRVKITSCRGWCPSFNFRRAPEE